jgi:hypothetical protein
VQGDFFAVHQYATVDEDVSAVLNCLAEMWAKWSGQITSQDRAALDALLRKWLEL